MNDIGSELNSAQKVHFAMQNVQETLLLPLWGRAVETQKKRPLLEDKIAVEIISQLDYDFSTIAENINEVVRMGWIARSMLIDRTIKQLLHENSQAVIVNIGCGFDTTFERVDNGSITWYDFDLPDVIELRRQFIPENNRRKMMAGSFLDYEWLDRLNVEGGRNIIFVAAGVFCYFDEYQIKSFFKKIANRFPNSEIIFDAFSPAAIKVSNKIVLEDGGMDEKTILKWGLRRAKDLSLWDSRFTVLGEYTLYKNVKSRFKGRDKIMSWISERLRMLYIVHLKF